MRIHGRVRFLAAHLLATVFRVDGAGREAVTGLASGVERVEGNEPRHGTLVLGILDPEPSSVRIPGRHVQGPRRVVRGAIEQFGPESGFSALGPAAGRTRAHRALRPTGRVVIIVPP